LARSLTSAVSPFSDKASMLWILDLYDKDSTLRSIVGPLRLNDHGQSG
jgi:hypothetical protein